MSLFVILHSCIASGQTLYNLNKLSLNKYTLTFKIMIEILYQWKGWSLKFFTHFDFNSHTLRIKYLPSLL